MKKDQFGLSLITGDGSLCQAAIRTREVFQARSTLHKLQS